MLKRLTKVWIAILLLFFTFAALGEEAGFTVSPALLRPGKMERISFSVPRDGTADILVLNEAGEKAAEIRTGLHVTAGENHLTWDGCDRTGSALKAGQYQLQLLLDGQEEACLPIEIGAVSPQVLSLSAPDQVSPGDVWAMTVVTNMPGIILCRIKLNDGEWHTFLEDQVDAGESKHYWNGIVDGHGTENGDYTIQIRLTDDTGFTGTPQQMAFSVVSERTEETPAPAETDAPADTTAPETENTPEPASVPTVQETPLPTHHPVVPGKAKVSEDENSYWTLPVGEMDEAAIWEVMMQPITVLEGEQKEVYRLRKNPDSSSKAENIVGEITYASQGVHILETREDGWTLVETFNSSYGPDCKSRRGYGVTDDLIQGYVKTSLLKTITPRTDYALLIDKLEQKMYIFSEGKCIGSLLVSTGLNNSTQSWNETPSGEFLMVSRMGGFPAGNLWCAYGMRINGGCAIHEVPYIGNADTPSSNRDYSSTVPQLGKKASHGCIRVQKAANENGQNIKWLWDNIKVNTKVLIWDDTGRFMDYPDDQMEIYYNPNNGKYYHENQYCSSVKDRYLPLTAITYAELNTAYDYLTPCNKCARLMKKAEIDEINRQNGF